MKLLAIYRQRYPEETTISAWKVQCIIEASGLYYSPLKQARINRKRSRSYARKRITELERKPVYGFLLCLDTVVRHWNGLGGTAFKINWECRAGQGFRRRTALQRMLPDRGWAMGPRPAERFEPQQAGPGFARILRSLPAQPLAKNGLAERSPRKCGEFRVARTRTNRRAPGKSCRQPKT
jgi:hypothetical protein